MSMPVRCFTCGYVVGKHEIRFQELRSQGLSDFEILKLFKIEKMCCRRMFLGYVDVYEKVQMFPEDIKTPNLLKKEKQ